ncbi:MAG: hypothetical protein JWP44_5242 [Mucilaginibacter sp.]|jgi:hypothetical protein|nr:hypothetical protein [Mucilaginibacter sp.]
MAEDPRRLTYQGGKRGPVGFRVNSHTWLANGKQSLTRGTENTQLKVGPVDQRDAGVGNKPS